MDFTQENHINSDLNACKSAVAVNVLPNQHFCGKWSLDDTDRCGKSQSAKILNGQTSNMKRPKVHISIDRRNPEALIRGMDRHRT